MDTKTTLPISEARKKIFKIADEVQKTGKYFTITEKGRPKAVIMSAEEFESWQETLEISKSPKLMKEIEEAEKEFARGEYVPLEEVLREEGFVLADKSKKKYEVSRRFKKKGSKKSKKNR